MSRMFESDLVLHKENKWRAFVTQMKEFPSLFHLGNCNLDVGEIKYSGLEIKEPVISKNKWEYLRESLKDDDDTEFEDKVWQLNVLTLAYAKLGDLEQAFKLNQSILDKYGNSNLVSQANAAFLCFRKGDLNKTYEIIDGLKNLKSSDNFSNLKLGAVCEQAFAFRVFGGAENLRCSISLLKFALSINSVDERLQFMLAMVYRRCTCFNIYTEDPKNINLHECAQNAAKSLFQLGTCAKSKNIRPAALIELAALKYDDDIIVERKLAGSNTKLSRTEWSQIVGNKSWRQLCYNAVETSVDNLSEKVFKIAGQLFRYFGSDAELKKSEECLLKAIELKPTNRAHHHLGLTYRKMATQFEKKKQSPSQGNHKSNWQSTHVWKYKVLPQLNIRPPTFEKYFKYLTKVPAVEVRYFSSDNTFTGNATEHFEQAVKLSWYQNLPAVYDLASILLQTRRYGESKMVCNKVFAESSAISSNPVLIVNLHNLYGICCLEEALVATDEIKARLLAEAEENLIMTVRLASKLAAQVPALATCETELWKAFDTLLRTFKCEKQQGNNDKVFKLCELVNDLKCLETLDEILSQDASQWENMEVIEQCLKRYLSMRRYDSALLFRDIIYLMPEVKRKAQTSEVFRQLMLEIAELKLDNTYSRREPKGLYLPDPVWKQLLCDEFQTVGKLKAYDVVVVCDVHDDCEPKLGTPSENISKHIKHVLNEIFGLKVVRAHEEAYFGPPMLEQLLKIISRSLVAIFVLPNPCSDSESLEQKFNSAVRLSEDSVGATEHSDTALLGETSVQKSPTTLTTNTGPVNVQETSNNSMFTHIINTSVANHFTNVGASHIMLVHSDQLQLKDLPLTFHSMAAWRLLDKDAEALSMFAEGQCSDECITLMKKLFRAILNKSQT